MDAANFCFRHPRGPIYGYISDKGVRELRLPRGDASDTHIYLLHSGPNIVVGQRLHAVLEQYFQGTPVSFQEIPLDFGTATAFQRVVWDAARAVRWGCSCTYGELADRLGKGRGAARAIGCALGANPLAVLVPCHRILAADGGLTGYAAGIEWKQELLKVEGLLHC